MLGSSSPVGLTPSQIATAYNFGLGTPANNGGAGTTIAIVDAYNDPNIQQDLGTFSTQFGLPYTAPNTPAHPRHSPCSLRKADELTGERSDGRLGARGSPRRRMAHAMAPNANILLIEANSPSTQDLLNAVAVADAFNGSNPPPAAPVVAVSMSWGGSAPGNVSGDNTTYFSTSGITYFAAAGDSGPGAEWPASSVNVVGVGGTTLNSTGSISTNTTETVWADSGGGPMPAPASRRISQTWVVRCSRPPRTAALPTSRSTPTRAPGSPCTTRLRSRSPRASAGSDPPTTEVYDWVQLGGTSVGTPQWAAIAADADAIRGSAAAPPSATATPQFLPAIYAIGHRATPPRIARDFIDINSGTTVAVRSGRQIIQYSAATGYDFVTGLGSPNVANLLEQPDHRIGDERQGHLQHP